MSDMPERIIARVDYDGEWDGQWCEPGREPLGVHAYYHAEYVRADRLKALEAENARLRNVEGAAIRMWHHEAKRAAPNVAKRRTPEQFWGESADTQERWIGLARAALDTEK